MNTTGIDTTSTAVAVVVVGGAPLDGAAVAAVPPTAAVIAADSGLDHALTAGLTPSLLIGDLDSISEDGLAWAQHHATINRYDTAKDATDTELALAAAADLNPDHLIVLAGHGDRFDHSLGIIGALGHRSLTSIPQIDLYWADQRIRMLHGPGQTRLTNLRVGTTLSLLATHGPCEDVSASGVRWPLDHDNLDPLSGRGISNVTTASTVEISVVRGNLAIALVARR